MNVPPPATPVLTSLPRGLPASVAAASLAATLRHARRRRIRRCTIRAAGTVAAVSVAGLLAFWGTDDFPAPGARTMADNGSPLNPGPAPATSPPQNLISPENPAAVVTVVSTFPAPAPPTVIAKVPANPNSADRIIDPGKPSMAEKPPASFVLVRTNPAETVRTQPLKNASSPPPTLQAPVLTRASAGFTLVSTRSIPAPLVITTRNTVAPQSIATADQPHTPSSASDADLFAHADGRPAALCRLNSGGTRWFWLDQPPSGQF